MEKKKKSNDIAVESNGFSITKECEPYVEGFEGLCKAFMEYTAFHDSWVKRLDYSYNALAHKAVIDFETEEIHLKFINVHALEIDFRDIPTEFFWGLGFYIKDWCDYGKCIVMDVEGFPRIVADKVVFIPN